MEAATITRPVRFAAKSPNQRLVIQAEHWEKLDVQNRQVSPPIAPVAIQFEDNFYSTSDPEELAFLRGHQLFNVKFWEEGAAPDEAQPTLTEQMIAIAQAAANADSDALEQLLADELETHNRAPVTRAAEEALDTVKELEREAEAVEPEPGDETLAPEVTPDEGAEAPEDGEDAEAED